MSANDLAMDAKVHRDGAANSAADRTVVLGAYLARMELP
jgi:hypothetical protein